MTTSSIRPSSSQMVPFTQGGTPPPQGQVGSEEVGDTISNSMSESEKAARDAQLNANDAQNRMAILSATLQVAALARSMMMQTLRDFIKDAKDTVKDQGEAGHKP